MIKSVACALILIPAIVLSQHRIEGKITLEGNSIAGATVKLEEIEEATLSDQYGAFSLLNIPAGRYTLEVRYVGCKPIKKDIRVPLAGKINLAMKEQVFSMEEVVVTGTLQPTFVSASPVKVEVITSAHLDTFTPSAGTSLVGGAQLINGVQEVVGCGVCFTNSLSIHGLPGAYTAVLLDGAPIYGNLASVYGLNGIPSALIERIEVIKGPSSTLYGSEAVAGVINVISKKPSSQPLATVELMGNSFMDIYSTLSYAPSIGHSKGFASLHYGYANGFVDQNEDLFGDNINLDRLSFFTKWDLHRPSGKAFTLAARYLYEDRRNGTADFISGRNYRSLRGDGDIYGESIYTHRAELYGTYELNVKEAWSLTYSLSTHHQDSYYGSDHYQAAQQVFFTNLIWKKPFDAHDITAGLTSRYQLYDDNTIATELNGYNRADRQYIPGIFAQDEWSFSDRLTLLTGARLDHYTSHGLIFSPRVNAKYKIGSHTSLRSNFGTGFRIVNLFTEDHAFITGQREVIIEESLKPERSLNGSLNLNHLFTIGESQGMVDVDIFYTHFTNKIIPDYDQEGEIRYANTPGHAVSKGLGINLQQEFYFPLSYTLGFNIQRVEEKVSGRTESIPFAPKHTGVFTLDYRLKKLKSTMGYSANLTGRMSLPAVYDLGASGDVLDMPRPTVSSPFATHHLKFTTTLSDSFSLYIGAQNLLNYTQPWSPVAGANDPNSPLGFGENFDTAYAYGPLQGRTFYVGFRWTL